MTDASLPPTGFELNTQPTNGDKFVDVIRVTCKALNRHDARVTPACGYHVHVDARDFNFHDIARLIRLYARLEPALKQCVSPSRRGMHYCADCGSKYLGAIERNSDDVEEGIARGVYDTDKTEAQRRKRSKYDCARYAAMNLHSWLFRGTIECRLHQGTTNASKVINWALLWASIIDAAKTRCVEPLPVGSLPLDFNPLPIDPWDCLLSLAPSDDIRAWLIARRDELSDND